MKKILFALTALSLLPFVSCEKEVENTLEETPVETTGEMMTIEARMSKESTKTSYTSDGKFTWLSTDQIIVITHADGDTDNQKNFTFSTSAGNITEEGRAATFTGTVTDGYTIDYAAYPTSLASDNTDSGYAAPFVKVPSSVSGLVSSAMLIGIGDGAGGYTFNTAMSLFKINVSGIPAAAAEIRLVTSDKANYPLDGDFTLEESAGVVTLDFAHYHSEWSAYDKGYQTIDISAEGAIDDRDFYFNVPIGTYPARTLSIQVLDGSDNIMDEKVITKALTTNRNELLTLPALTMNCWETLGTAEFYDKGPSNNWNYYHALIPIQRNTSNGNQYRLVNPYGAYKVANNNTDVATPDPYLVFTVDPSTNLVTFERHATGMVLSDKPIVIQHPSVDGRWDGNTFDASYNKVRQEDGSGNPLIIQLAPFYCFSDNTNGWSRNNYNHLIEIIFPEYATATDLTIACDSAPSDDFIHITVSGTNVATAKVSANRYANFATNMSDEFAAATGTTFTGYDATGLYTRQFAIQAYNSDGTEIYHNYIEKVVYSLTSADATNIVGTYSRTVNSTDIGGGTPPATSSIALTESTDVFAGQVMISAFDGTAFTNGIIGQYTSSSYQCTFSTTELWKDNNFYIYRASGPNTNPIVLQFVDSSLNSLYSTNDFGVASTNSYPPTWTYWYRGGSDRVYTK